MTTRIPLSSSRRRSARKGDRTERAILDTAERLLHERPLASIGIDELAAGAGISRPSFYFYFQSREAVLRALAERIADELHRSTEAWPRRDGESPEDALRRVTGMNLALWRQHGAVLRATVHARETDPELRGFWDAVSRRFIDQAAAQIERERAAGLALAEPPARSLAAVLIGMNVRAFQESSTTRRSAPADRRLVDTLTAVWLRAIYGA